MIMQRRPIQPDADFQACVAALESPAALWLVHVLLQLIATDPECAPWVAAMNVRVLRLGGLDHQPLLSLYYTFDDRAVYPLYVELSDWRLL
jgi:hypothetical protein